VHRDVAPAQLHVSALPGRRGLAAVNNKYIRQTFSAWCTRFISVVSYVRIQALLKVRLFLSVE
jgi:hypothetical protein